MCKLFVNDNQASKTIFIAGHHMLVMCGGQTEAKEITSTCLATQPRKKTWKRLASMPFRLFNAASAVVNDKMYVIGGMDDKKAVKKTGISQNSPRIF